MNIKAFEIYDTFHFCGCGKLITHSQGDWDTHKNHKGKMRTWPIEALKKYSELKDKIFNYNVIRDLLASYLVKHGFYKNYKQAHKAMTELCQDLIWNDLTNN